MVNIVSRMRQLRAKLLTIRVGPGAAILPPEVTKIHMQFCKTSQLGPRRFWKECLPRLKYHNPTVSMTINRTEKQKTPLMTIHFTENGTTRTEEFNMKRKQPSEILRQLIDVTRAKELEPTAEDIALAEELTQQQKISEEDSKRCLEINAEKKRQEATLKGAREQIEAAKAAAS